MTHPSSTPAVDLFPDEPRELRVALYSHDAVGLGHLRRNMLIARTLAAPPLRAAVLMLAGAAEVNLFERVSGVDWVTVPGLWKESHGTYVPRSLAVSAVQLTELRATTLRAAVASFAPDVLVVDKLPRGVRRELDPVLEDLRTEGRTRCVLGLRDILDEREAVLHEWREAGNFEVVRDYYDAIWVYGDPRVYDLAQEYEFPRSLARRLRYTGYLDRIPRSGRGRRGSDVPREPYALCVLGGGEDGTAVADAFSQASLPRGWLGVILTGPYFPEKNAARLRERARHNPRLRVLKFSPEPTELMRRARRVVAMGGYNTVCELLALRKNALIVPRVSPRKEQLLRAERLAKQGLVDLLHPDRLTPAAIGEWFGRKLEPPPVRERIDLRGLERLPRLLLDVLADDAEGEWLWMR